LLAALDPKTKMFLIIFGLFQGHMEVLFMALVCLFILDGIKLPRELQ